MAVFVRVLLRVQPVVLWSVLRDGSQSQAFQAHEEVKLGWAIEAPDLDALGDVPLAY